MASVRTWCARPAAALLAAWYVLGGPGVVGVQAQVRPPAGTERVLVMPFENVSQDGKIVWLSEAAAVLLADDLNALGLRAIPREERQEAFDRLQVPPAAALTDATVLRIGQIVGATSVVLGSVRLEGEVLVAEAREVVLDSARLRHRATERGPLADMFETFARVARQLSPNAVRTAAAITPQHPPIAAFESYIKGVLAENPKTAVTYLQAALDAHESYDRARLALWDAYTEQGDHKAAAAAVEAVPAGASLSHRARFLLGLSLIELHRYDDAFEAYAALADERPTPAVFNNLGIVQMRRGGTAAGGSPASFFTRATELDPADAVLFFNLGYAYWSVRDSGATIRWLREAVRRNPADGEAHYVLGTALGLAGDPTEAAREKELARRLSSTFAEWDKRPQNEPVPRGLERLKHDVSLPAVRRTEEAQSGGRDQQTLAAFYVERGRRLYEQEADRAAAAELNRALFLAPYHADANLLLGRVHQRSGRLAEAIGSYKISIWSAESAAAHAALASAYLEVKDDESARVEATRALDMDPGSSEARQVIDRLAQPAR